MVALALGTNMETIPGASRLRMSIMRVGITHLLVSILQRGIGRDDGRLGGEGDAVLAGTLVLQHDVLDAIGAGEGGARQRVAELGLVRGPAVAVGEARPAAAAAAAGPAVGAVRGEHPAGAHVLHAAAEERVDHWDVADHDGDEGLAHGPAAGLLGAVCTRLPRGGLLVW